jgi:hypothetical protein
MAASQHQAGVQPGPTSGQGNRNIFLKCEMCDFRDFRDFRFFPCLANPAPPSQT